MVLKGPNLNSPPGDLLDDAGVMLRSNTDHIANLKGPVGLQRYTGKEIPQRVLQCQSEDDAENRGGREYSAQVGIRKYERKDEEEECGKGDDRKDIPDQGWRIKAASKPNQTKNERVEGAYNQVGKNCKRS